MMRRQQARDSSLLEADEYRLSSRAYPYAKQPILSFNKRVLYEHGDVAVLFVCLFVCMMCGSCGCFSSVRQLKSESAGVVEMSII